MVVCVPPVLKRTMLALVLIMTGTTYAVAATMPFKPGLEGKKLISYGQDWPNPAYIRAQIREMEEQPFDGIVIGVTASREPQLGGKSLGTNAWGRKAFDRADYQHAIDDLKATRFEKFTDNFIQVEAMPAEVDWFDPDWESVIHNFQILAHIARESGCVGLAFDPEEYNDAHIFTPARWPKEKRSAHSDAEYAAQALRRGEQLMRAINVEFPGIRILCLFGPTLSANSRRSGGHEYPLLASFLEGMCRAADTGTQIIDGYEQSYGYRAPIAFEFGRQSILEAREIFADKAAFDRVMRVGFGLWTDYNSGKRGWFGDEPLRNHFQPETWQNAVHFALSQSDRYVWIWREKIHVWADHGWPRTYEAATRDAREAAPAKWAVVRREVPDTAQTLLAEGRPRDWQSTFADLLETQSVLVDLSTPGWEFRIDGQDQWSPIEVGKFWEEQGWDYDGVAWYRRTFALDASPDGPVQIVFGACDESAEVWLNGTKLGSHDRGEAGWDQRFSFDLMGKLRAGTNELLVRAIDRTGPGGIWKPVTIFTNKKRH
jgi:hypothetical protein